MSKQTILDVHKQRQYETRNNPIVVVRRQQLQAAPVVPPLVFIDTEQAASEWAMTYTQSRLYRLLAIGRGMHDWTDETYGIIAYSTGYYHYDITGEMKYKTGKIAAIYVALCGKDSIKLMPTYTQMIRTICTAVAGCTKDELEAL